MCVESCIISTALTMFSLAQSERQAINTAIQGSAADLVKLAMVRIAKALRQAFPRAPTHLTQPTSHGQEISGAFLVLQLHDELVYEVKGTLKGLSFVIRKQKILDRTCF